MAGPARENALSERSSQRESKGLPANSNSVLRIYFRRCHRRPVDYFVYILRCADQSLYVGHAEDVLARVERHNRGEGAWFTRRRTPVSVALCERHPSRRAAAARERQIKGWNRAKKEALIAKDFSLLKRL